MVASRSAPHRAHKSFGHRGRWDREPDVHAAGPQFPVTLCRSLRTHFREGHLAPGTSGQRMFGTGASRLTRGIERDLAGARVLGRISSGKRSLGTPRMRPNTQGISDSTLRDLLVLK